MRRDAEIARLIALARLIEARDGAQAARAQADCQAIEARIATHRAALAQAERALEAQPAPLDLAQAQLRFAQNQSRALQMCLQHLARAEVTRIAAREVAAKALGRRASLEKLARKLRD